MMIHMGKWHNDLTVRPSPGNHWWILGESSPSMAELFRLVNYCNLPIYHGELDPSAIWPRAAKKIGRSWSIPWWLPFCKTNMAGESRESTNWDKIEVSTGFFSNELGDFPASHAGYSWSLGLQCWRWANRSWNMAPSQVPQLELRWHMSPCF